MPTRIPELSLVVLVGASRLRQVHVRPQALPADRGALVRLLPRPGLATTRTTRRRPNDAFEVLHFIAAKRLARGRLTVIDATNVQPEARKPLVELAGEYHCLPVAIVLDLPEQRLPGAQPRRGPTATSARTSSASSSRSCGGRCAACSARASATSSSCDTPEEVDAADDRARSRCGTTARHEHGPFDIIGDVHGCCDELRDAARAARLRGRRRRRTSRLGEPRLRATREGRKAVFLGDLVDRGPRILDVLRLVMEHGRGRHGPVRARQPRHEAAAQAARQGRADHPRPGRDAGRDRRPARRRARAVPQGAGRVPRRPGQPLRPRRRQAGRRPRRA